MGVESIRSHLRGYGRQVDSLGKLEQILCWPRPPVFKGQSDGYSSIPKGVEILGPQNSEIQEQQPEKRAVATCHRTVNHTPLNPGVPLAKTQGDSCAG